MQPAHFWTASTWIVGAKTQICALVGFFHHEIVFLQWRCSSFYMIWLCIFFYNEARVFLCHVFFFYWNNCRFHGNFIGQCSTRNVDSCMSSSHYKFLHLISLLRDCIIPAFVTILITVPLLIGNSLRRPCLWAEKVFAAVILLHLPRWARNLRSLIWLVFFFKLLFFCEVLNDDHAVIFCFSVLISYRRNALLS